MSIPAIVAGIAFIIVVLFIIFLKSFKKPRRLQRIWEQIQTGDTRNAIKNLKIIILKHGGSVDAHYLLAECYRREGNCDMAVVQYRYCLKQSKKTSFATISQIREGLVECLLVLKKEDEALTELLELSRTDPKKPDYLVEIAKIFYRRGNIEQAVIYFDKTVKYNPAHAEALGYLGIIMYHANQVKEAMGYLARAIRCDPRNYQAYYYLGRVYMDGRDFAKAITYFEASQRSPEYRVRAFLQKGNCYREMNEFENAVDQYKKGIAAAGTKDQSVMLATKYALASIYESRGKLAEAIELWEGIQKINPSFRDVPQKLEQYQYLRMDDNMKDFLVSPKPIFEGICLDVVRHLGYEIIDIRELKPGITAIIAAPVKTAIRGPGRQYVYVKVYREAVNLGLHTVKILLEEAKKLHCVKAICISPVEFKPEAVEFALSRPIDLIDGQKLSRILSEIRG